MMMMVIGNNKMNYDASCTRHTTIKRMLALLDKAILHQHSLIKQILLSLASVFSDQNVIACLAHIKDSI